MLNDLSDSEKSAYRMIAAWRRFDWDDFLLGWCAAFHLLCAFTLMGASQHQLVTQGTQPVFQILNRYAWGGLFFVAFAGCVALYEVRHYAVKLVTLLVVFFIGGTWGTAFLVNVVNGHGSAIGLIAWPFLYVPWFIVAIRIAIGNR